MHRFFVEGLRIVPGGEIDLAAYSHQIRRVLRLRVGDQIVLLNNQGGSFLCEISLLNAKGVTGQVLEQTPGISEPQLQLVLYQCVLKGDRLEWVLQKGTELGVAIFVPVISQRSIVQSALAVRKKYERWRTIIREAAEQCGRGRLPSLEAPIEFSSAIEQARGCCLLPWENAEGAVGIGAALDGIVPQNRKPHRVSLLIGPEGGLARDEVDRAQRSGWQVVTLGRRILRAETAALAATTLLMGWAGELGAANRQDSG